MSRLIRAGRLGQMYVGWDMGHTLEKTAGEWSFAIGKLHVIASRAESPTAWEIV